MDNLEFMNQWVDAQKKMADQWTTFLTGGKSENSAQGEWLKQVTDAQQKFFTDMTKSFVPGVNGFNPFANFAPFNMTNPTLDSLMQSQKEMFNGFQKMYQEGPMGAYIRQFPDLNTYLENYRQQFDPSKLVNVLDSESYNTLVKMMDANKQYLTLYRYFDNLREVYGKPFEKDGKELMNKWIDNNNQFYNDFVEPFIPVQVRDILNAPYKLNEAVKGSWGNFLGPWAESFFELTRLYVEGSNGDAESLAEFFEVWKEKYNETIAPLFKVPGMGNNTEKIESHNQFIDNTIQLIITSVEFQQKLSAVTRNRAKELVEEYVQLVKKGENPKTYKEFYHYWTSEVEKTLQEYFYSDEFSSMLGKFGTANAQFVIARNKVIEIALRKLPIVLESDARSLYKKVQELKREVNKLKRELKEVKSGEATEKPAVKKPAAKKPAAK